MIGQTLSHYRIVDKIGAGGMGEVYKAHDERLDRDVAIKVLPSGTLDDENARKRFRKEALALSKLNHPNIATVHDFDTQEGVDFIVMELVEGTSLAEKVKPGPLPENEISELGAQIADALEEAHERGIVHRDLKPGNIAVTPKGRVKVLDFGLARILRPVSDEATTEAMTEELGLAGTLPYKSPEELRGERADHRSDLYSFGVVLYEMATGKRPFEHSVSTALVDAIIHKPAEPPRTHNRKVSPGLERIIHKALDKGPNRRYQSALEMRVDLERLSAPDRLAEETGPRVESIAVLPLENLSGDPEQEYFADGMTDELICQLAQISALKVISRTSVKQYKDARKPLPAIAKELNVEAVVEGTVRRSGDRVRITAQLIEAATDRHLWAESYERDMQDILALQSEVAQAIAHKIQITVTPEEQALLARARPVDPEVYEDYLRGNYFFNKASVEAWLRAIDYYEQAIEKDPQYAPPHAARAHTLAILPTYSGGTPQKLYPKSKDAAQKAIELDDTLAKAHIALGSVELFYDWDWAVAEREFMRAIELEPGSAEAHLYYGFYLVWMGRSEHGIAQGRHAIELDPLSLLTNAWMGAIFYYARRYEEAIDKLKKILDMEPNFYQALLFLSYTYAKKERYEDALSALHKMHDLAGLTDVYQFCYAYVHALWGKRDEVMRTLMAPGGAEWSTWGRAVAYGALGEKDEAFLLLDQAYEERYSVLAVAKEDPRLDPLRDDPRFQDLLRRMNFPE